MVVLHDQIYCIYSFGLTVYFWYILLLIICVFSICWSLLQSDEADVLLSMVEDPGSFAVIVMKTLRGYFLLMKGCEQEVLELVALPVSKALDADHGVLHFPLCWHM